MQRKNQEQIGILSKAKQDAFSFTKRLKKTTSKQAIQKIDLKSLHMYIDKD